MVGFPIFKPTDSVRFLNKVPRVFVLYFVWVAAASIYSTTLLADGVWEAPAEKTNYHLEFSKSERTLRIKHGSQIYREFVAASGSGGAGDKTKTGDKHTPEGIYRITGFNNKSKFFLFMRLNYPNVKDAFYGLKNGIISRNEFDGIVGSLKQGRMPPQTTALGGAIGIHGVGLETDEKLRIQAHMDWTDGCIALTNEDVTALRAYVQVGTEVVILQ